MVRRRSLPCTDAMSTDPRKFTTHEDRPERVSSAEPPGGKAKDDVSMYASVRSATFKTFALSSCWSCCCWATVDAGAADGGTRGTNAGAAPSLRLNPKRALGAVASRLACTADSSDARCYCQQHEFVRGVEGISIDTDSIVLALIVWREVLGRVYELLAEARDVELQSSHILLWRIQPLSDACERVRDISMLAEGAY